MSDKGAPTSFEQLAEVRRVQQETGRIYSVCFSERFEVPAVLKAQELVAQGRIGRVVQTTGLGPHRVGLHNRPDWFFQKAAYGGILTDIASHQFDQFLVFTGSIATGTSRSPSQRRSPVVSARSLKQWREPITLTLAA